MDHIIEISKTLKAQLLLSKKVNKAISDKIANYDAQSAVFNPI